MFHRSTIHQTDGANCEFKAPWTNESCRPRQLLILQLQSNLYHESFIPHLLHTQSRSTTFQLWKKSTENVSSFISWLSTHTPFGCWQCTLIFFLLIFNIFTGQTPGALSSIYESHFEEGEVLGQGSYGEVLKVRCKQDQRWYAVKRSKPFTSKSDRYISKRPNL